MTGTLSGQIVFQVGADLLVCTLRLLPDALGVQVQVGLVVDFKVIGLKYVPFRCRLGRSHRDVSTRQRRRR